jgi:hypothetical protein
LPFLKSVILYSASRLFITKSKIQTQHFVLCLLIFTICILHLPCAAVAEAATVKIGWTPSISAVAGYKVCYGRYSYNYNYVVDVGNNTSCSISGLDIGTTYYFAVKAYDANGRKSDYSNELAYKIPDTITNLAMSSVGGPKLEVGGLQIDHNWKYVKYKNTYANPIVIANSMSLNGKDPAVTRIRKVGQSGFEIRVQEWDYLDGTHAVETASYLVIERGSYTLADGTQVEAGLFKTAKTGSFARVSFNKAFQRKPVVMASVSSFNGADTVTARLRNITREGFDLCMQEQESNTQKHVTETIGYIAWEPSIGTVNGLTFEVGKTSDSVTHNFYTIQFAQNFATTPRFIANMQTSDGMDTASIRWDNKDAYAVEVQIQEEQSLDIEVNHTTEVVGYMVFSR